MQVSAIMVTRIADDDEEEEHTTDPTSLFFDDDGLLRSRLMTDDSSCFVSPRQFTRERLVLSVEQCCITAEVQSTTTTTDCAEAPFEGTDGERLKFSCSESMGKVAGDDGLVHNSISSLVISGYDRSVHDLLVKIRNEQSQSPQQSFAFIFTIPLRKLSGELNNQWLDATLSVHDQTDYELKRVLVDPCNFDITFYCILPASALSTAEFTVKEKNGLESDGPYKFPDKIGEYFCLRDGHVTSSPNSLACGIQLTFDANVSRQNLVLAYWNEVSGEWQHVPLHHLTTVTVHQKRCLANVFDVNHGRRCNDQLFRESGRYRMHI